MAKLPTDLEVLEAIYNRYFDNYTDYKPAHRSNLDTQSYLPIDIKVIADELGVPEGIILGRLVYHLNRKYGYKLDDYAAKTMRGPTFVAIFIPEFTGELKNCVNMPLVVSVLSDLQEQDEKHKTAMNMAEESQKTAKKSYWQSWAAILITLAIAVFTVWYSTCNKQITPYNNESLPLSQSDQLNGTGRP